MEPVPDSQELQQSEKSQKKVLVYKVVKQILLVCLWICLGLCVEIVGPTLPDLKERLRVSYEEIGLALTGFSGGYFLGSVIGGFIFERLRRLSDPLLVMCTWIMAIVTASIPWMSSITLLGLIFGINGTAAGVLNIGGNVMVLDLWGERASSPMQSLHFGFGFGAIIVPQIVRPFLKPDVQRLVSPSHIFINNSISVTEMSLLASTTINVTSTDVQSAIKYPYFIVSAITIFFGALFLMLFIRGAPEGLSKSECKTNVLKYIHPKTCSPESPKFSVGILACLFVYFIHTQGGERAYGKFLFTYAMDSDNKFNKGAGTALLSVFWMSFTIGRASGIIIAKFVPTQIMMLSEILGSLVAAIVLSIFAFNNATVLWVFSFIIGFFIARLCPSGVSWANIYLKVNSVAVMVLFVGAASGGFIYQYTTGYLFDMYGTRSLMYVMLVNSVNLIIIFAIMQPIASWHGKITSTIVEENNKECIEEKASLSTTSL